MNKINVNKQVTITALGFRKNLASFPKRMEYDGDTINFIDAGIRCLVKYGSYIAEFFTLSDGESLFHLRLDKQNNYWTLISISS